MIEGIASTVANAQASKPVTQVSSGESAAKIEANASPAPKAPYISPFIKLDMKANKAVIQVRDSETGDVVRQFPSESAMKARQIADAERERSQQARRTLAGATSNSPSPQVESSQSDGGVQDVQVKQAISALSAASVSTESTPEPSTTDVTA